MRLQEKQVMEGFGWLFFFLSVCWFFLDFLVYFCFGIFRNGKNSPVLVT